VSRGILLPPSLAAHPGFQGRVPQASEPHSVLGWIRLPLLQDNIIDIICLPLAWRWERAGSEQGRKLASSACPGAAALVMPVTRAPVEKVKSSSSQTPGI